MHAAAAIDQHARARARERGRERKRIGVAGRGRRDPQRSFGRSAARRRFRSSSKAGKDLLSLLPLPSDSSQVSQDASAKLQTRREEGRWEVSAVPLRRHYFPFFSFAPSPSPFSSLSLPGRPLARWLATFFNVQRPLARPRSFSLPLSFSFSVVTCILFRTRPLSEYPPPRQVRQIADFGRRRRPPDSSGS
ncbi:hypothetical protein X777_10792 [Ooceraea biroi]|uniref:Uncharacterized protein n=1 Tax=Ooceraea biroi TaxID=2015173 RepID=A0A026W3W1_OOCBI|nr:hypothetical protein X777_10792 [Ooceraea biroi]